MKRRMKVLTALLCVSAMVTGCGASGNSGTEAAKADTQKEGTKEAGKDTDSKEKTEVTIGFPVKVTLLTLVQDLDIQVLLSILLL